MATSPPDVMIACLVNTLVNEARCARDAGQREADLRFFSCLVRSFACLTNSSRYAFLRCLSSDDTGGCEATIARRAMSTLNTTIPAKATPIHYGIWHRVATIPARVSTLLRERMYRA